LRFDSSRDADWETVLSSAGFVSGLVPDALLHDEVEQTSLDPATTHTVANFEVKRRFAAVMADLERVSGWLPKPVGRIALNDGKLDNVESTIRDQTRSGPLETAIEVGPSGKVVVPTLGEMLRIKAWLVISRNAARDYRDTAAIAERLGSKIAVSALAALDGLYPQSNGASALQQLARQLSEPCPFASDESDGSRVAKPPWHGWPFVFRRCRMLAVELMLGLDRPKSVEATTDCVDP
jgi:hypothetical protein